LSDELRKEHIADGEASRDDEHQQNWQVIVKPKGCQKRTLTRRRQHRVRLLLLDHEIENHCTSVMLVELIKGVKQRLPQEKC